MNNDFWGRVALVTGGGSGIGRATALLLASRGAAVAVSDVNVGGAEETARMIGDMGKDSIAIGADVSQAVDASAMVDATTSRFGRLDLAVNNAGVGGGRSPLHEYPEADWNRTLAVNLTGVWLSMKSEIEAMLEGEGGVIVNVASVAGVVGYPRHAAYSASKHGVIGLTRTAALEYARSGIRVNAICPAFTRTPMVEAAVAASEDRLRKLESANPLGRLGTPEEIAEGIAFLCSPASGFAVGHALVLDGGLTAA